MTMTAKAAGPWLASAGLSGFLAVGFGAFGAHGLEGAVPPADLAAFRTGATYHLAHSVALVGVALAVALGAPAARWAGWLFLLGIMLFAGSLYVLGLTGSRALVLATPFGGLSFMAGWLMLGLSGWRLGQKDTP